MPVRHSADHVQIRGLPQVGRGSRSYQDLLDLAAVHRWNDAAPDLLSQVIDDSLWDFACRSRRELSAVFTQRTSKSQQPVNQSGLLQKVGKLIDNNEIHTSRSADG